MIYFTLSLAVDKTVICPTRIGDLTPTRLCFPPAVASASSSPGSFLTLGRDERPNKEVNCG
jgi:hypothetical protein